MTGAKIDKQKADYHDGGTDTPRVRCGTCVMFDPPMSCTLVAGSINASAICGFYEPDEEPTL